MDDVEQFSCVGHACIVAVEPPATAQFADIDPRRAEAETRSPGPLTRCLKFMNQLRAARNLPPLTFEWQWLMPLAHLEMQRSAAHDVYQGDAGFPQDVQSVGYPFRTAGRNDAYCWGFPDPTAQLDSQWAHSAPHYANIVHPAFTEVGIAFATSTRGHHITYGVVIFGAR
jgi:uncharacterized protein YkwD